MGRLKFVRWEKQQKSAKLSSMQAKKLATEKLMSVEENMKVVTTAVKETFQVVHRKSPFNGTFILQVTGVKF